MLDFSAHASEVVCVAIGANFLFPVAPSLLSRFLSNLETEPDRVLRDILGPAQKAEQHDIAEIAEAGKRIAEIRSRCLHPGFAGSLADCAAAVVGVLLLWTGLVDALGGWNILLFAPCLHAVAAAWFRFRPCRREYAETVRRIGERIRVRAEDAAARARFEAGVAKAAKLSGQSFPLPFDAQGEGEAKGIAK